MFYGSDGLAIVVLPVLWSVAGARSSQLTFLRAPAAIAGTARTALILCAVSSAIAGLFAVGMIADIGWFIDRGKIGLHLALTGLPAAAVATGTLVRLARLRRRARAAGDSTQAGLSAMAADPVLAVPPKVAAYAAWVSLYFAYVPHERIGLGELAAPFALVVVLAGGAVLVQRRRRAAMSVAMAATGPAARVPRIVAGAGIALALVAVLGVTAMTTSTTTGYDAGDVARAKDLAERTPVRTGLAPPMATTSTTRSGGAGRRCS